MACPEPERWSELADPARRDELEVHLDGCVSWSLYRAGATLVAVERWASRQAHDTHLQGAHVQELMGKMANLLAAPPSIVEYAIVED